jgi:Dolichyl-phosphate-mannose-protein mannosyltransferase
VKVPTAAESIDTLSDEPPRRITAALISRRMHPILQPGWVQATAQRTGRGEDPLEVSEVRPESRIGASGEHTPQPDRVQYAAYALSLAMCVSTWFVAIRAPLWLDEPVSFFLIKGGFAGIMSRQVWSDAPTYSYLLLLWTKVMGTSEITLRISSILLMVGAVYLLYCLARKLFERDIALIATIIFCLHPIIVFASIDVRPYAFAALAINSSVLALVSLRHNDSNWVGALFGLTVACIVQFQLLFAVILPALLICFLGSKLERARAFGDSLASCRLHLPGLPASYPQVANDIPHQQHSCLRHRSPAGTIGLYPYGERVGSDSYHRGSCCHENPAVHLRQPPGPAGGYSFVSLWRWFHP